MQISPLILALRWVIPAALLLVAGCATKRPAPVETRVATAPPLAATPVETPAEPAKPAEPAARLHVVQKGETLISIALQYGLDYKELAAWNYIENANVIQVGRELRVSQPGAAPVPSGVIATPLAVPGSPVGTPIPVTGSPIPATAGTPPSNGSPPVAGTPAQSGPIPASPIPSLSGNVKTEPKAVKLPYSDKALADLEAEARSAAATGVAGTPPAMPVAPPVAPIPPKTDDEAVVWAWPAKGKVLAGYTEASKGIDIGGAMGTPVLAAASGKVMYSGTGIRGYGKLVIIKHNNTYLSAYAHNNNVVVKEGQEVKKGDKIAEMGSSDADQVKLHFEIRRQGKPIDPAKLLQPN